MYEIYLDRLFFLNFSLDLLLLLSVKWTLGRTATRTRLVFSSVLSAAVYCVCFLFTGNSRLSHFFEFGILSIGMILGAFGFGNRGLFLDSLLTLYGYSCALGGGLLLFRKMLPMLAGSYGLPGSVLVTLGVVLAGKRICSRMQKHRKQMLYPVTVECNGQQWEMMGFLDTGNGLRDPILGRPVNVLDAELSRVIRDTIQPWQLVLVPYRTVGEEPGLLYAARVEKLRIYTEEGEKCVTDALVAFSQREFDREQTFQILLHQGMLE